MPPTASRPVHAHFAAEHLTIAAGVAIFHLASERVVLCYHTRDKYWFLPKGRRNANEDSGRGAEREGYEESGYRNRLLPIPMRHRQPDPDEGHPVFVKEPVWTEFLQLSERTQYLLHWYVGETVPRDVEESYSDGNVVRRQYMPPPPFPVDMTLLQRIEMDQPVQPDGKKWIYEPVWHEGTAVDEEEALYRASLLPIADACKKLRGTVMEDVVRRGWSAIQLRLKIEAET